MRYLIPLLIILSACKPADLPTATEETKESKKEEPVATTQTVTVPTGSTGVTGIVTSGLVLNLDAAKAAGTGAYSGCTANQWRDQSANANHASPSNMAGCADGTSGWSGSGTAADPYALAFDGIDDAAAGPTGVGFPTGSGARSITAWAYRYPGNVTLDVGTIAQYGPATQDNAFGIGVSNALKFYVGAWSNDLESSTAVISNNTWHHLAVTYAGTGNFNSTYIKGYVNGTGVTLVPPVGNSGTPVNTTSTAFTIGANPVPGYNFKGKISGVQVYNRELTAAEVKQNCEADKAKFQGASCP